MKKYRGIIVVGGTGSGKTTFVKTKIVKNYNGPKFIYDVNNEYEGGLMMDIDKFIGIGKALSNHLIIIEEATIFFSNKGDNKELAHILVTKRHRSNVIVLCFHNLQAVPVNILNMCDLMVLMKTNDNPRIVETKFKQHSNIYPAYLSVVSSPKQFVKTFVPLRM